MKPFLYLYATAQIALSAIVLTLMSHSGCGIEYIPTLQIQYPHWAVMSIATLSIGLKRLSVPIVLLAGALMWYPTALSWSAICSCHNNSWLPPAIALATALPLIPAYALTTRQNTTGAWVFCLLYLTGVIPAIFLIQNRL
ncbi:MAG: hypothetical protein IKZ13_05210 [Akkermansia sp.]|nr:hypothetical protein [Akkermansia sp.]